MSRPIARLLAVSLVLALFGAPSARSADPPAIGVEVEKQEADKPAISARKLTVSTFPRGEADPPQGPVLSSNEELEKYAGKQAAAELARQVAFDKENVVAVRYETGGPPFGVLKWEVAGEGAERRLEFFVEEPVLGPGQARGRALKLGHEFFAVPKGTPVKLRGIATAQPGLVLP